MAWFEAEASADSRGSPSDIIRVHRKIMQLISQDDTMDSGQMQVAESQTVADRLGDAVRIARNAG